MPSSRPDGPLAGKRRSARDLIEAILQNMRENLEPLKYSTLAPSRYLVYVHQNEYARIEGIIPILQDEVIRALTEALNHLNSRSALRRAKDRLVGGQTPPVHNPNTEWQVEFLADPDGDLTEGDIVIYSDLLLPARPELGIGERTRRVTTEQRGPRRTTRAHSVGPSDSSTGVFARLVWDDDAGHHADVIGKDSVTIGRGGFTFPIDIRISSSPDVSREHARIRRDSKTGQFFLIDLSSLGTTLNGRHVPAGFDELDGAKRENGIETALPDGARIGLADVVNLEFIVEP